MATIPHLTPAARAAARSLAGASLLTAPLSVGTQRLGVLVVGRSVGRVAFAESDVPVVEELGRRLAVGLTNARAFAREHGVAETLQRSVLPDSLPAAPGLDLAVRYLPATEGVGVIPVPTLVAAEAIERYGFAPMGRTSACRASVCRASVCRASA